MVNSYIHMRTVLILMALILAVSYAQAQSTNADFNPFPQMEQDESNAAVDQDAPQNADQWPPTSPDASNGVQS